MVEKIPLGYSEYITQPEDLALLKSVVLPKLEQGKPVNLFCSFSYFTSNYSGIFLVNELSNLIKKGCNLYLIMWDINSQSHRRFQRILNHQEHKITAEEIIDQKINEVLDLFHTFKVPKSKINIYRASDVLQRFIKKQDPNLFIQFYSILERTELNELVHKHKASHLIQMPLDMFFANFFHKLYPEDIKSKIDLALAFGYQEKIYLETRKRMYKQEIIYNLSPLLLVLPHYPYLIHNDDLPEWRMSRDSIVTHILSCEVEKEEIEQMYDVVLKKVLDKFELLDEKNKVRILSLKEFLREHKKLSFEKQKISLGYNVFNYLQKVKDMVVPMKKERILRLSNYNDIAKYSKLLSRKPLVSILKHINGKQNATQLAKELKIARSNMSTYLQTLKSNNLITIDKEGIIHRNINVINTNFEVGVH
jgi:hypothetical protein